MLLITLYSNSTFSYDAGPYVGKVEKITVNAWSTNVSIKFYLSGHSEPFVTNYNASYGKPHYAALLLAKSTGCNVCVYATGGEVEWSWNQYGNNTYTIEIQEN